MALTITKRSRTPFRKKKSAGSKEAKSKWDWLAIRDEWLSMNISGTRINMKDFAAMKGIDIAMMRWHSATGKWPEELNRRLEEIEQRVGEQLVQRSADSIIQVRQALASDEASVRERHAKLARGMQGKAVTRLNQIPVEELTAREAIDLLRFGMQEERRALGIADEIHMQVDGRHHIIISREQELFEQHLLVHQNVQQAVGEALKLLEDKTSDADTD